LSNLFMCNYLQQKCLYQWWRK